MRSVRLGLTLFACLIPGIVPLTAQTPARPAAAPNPFALSPEERAKRDRRRRRITPTCCTSSGSRSCVRDAIRRPGSTNLPNYDPAKADPFPIGPRRSRSKDGRRVTTAEQWWRSGRPEIAADFERRCSARSPPAMPRVTWEVTETVSTKVGGIPVVAQRVISHVDNTAFPSIPRGHPHGGGAARRRHQRGAGAGDVQLGPDAG